MSFSGKIFGTFFILAFTVGFLYLFSTILPPFIFAIIIAYFLNPLAHRLAKYRISRTYSALIIVGSFIAIITSIFIILTPFLYHEFLLLIDLLPGYIDIFVTQTYPKIIFFINKIGTDFDPDLRHHLSSENISRLLGFSGNFVSSLMASSMALINILSLIFITPIVTFYILRDWNVMIDQINKYLPKHSANNIRKFCREADKTLAACVRGQFAVCLILGLFYATFLALSGLESGFLIGLLTGLFSFIPYIGMLIGVTIGIIVALFQWGLDVVNLSVVGLVFFAGQILEGNFLTPKLVGNKIGVHPALVIFGLFACASLFGFWGILLALPIVAIISTLIKFIVAEYLNANSG